MIVDNVCKVVEDPAAVLPVMPLLDPLVKRVVEQISYSEADSVAERAYFNENSEEINRTRYGGAGKCVVNGSQT